MPQRELECDECGAILDLYTPPESEFESFLCPNCGGTQLFEIAFTDELTLELTKAFLESKPPTKKKH